MTNIDQNAPRDSISVVRSALGEQMHIFHKWDKWSEPKDSVHYFIDERRGVIIPHSDHTVTEQASICKKCGKYRYRRVS